MNNANYILGLDLGTSGFKAILCDTEGSVIDTKSAEYSPDYIGRGFVEQDPAVWKNAAFKVIKEMTSAHPGKKIKRDTARLLPNHPKDFFL